MTGGNSPRWRARSGFAAAAALALLLAAHTRAAEGQQRQYKSGDMVEMQAGEAYRIIRCNGAGEWDECEVQGYRDGKPSGNHTLRMTIRDLRAGEQRLRDAQARASGTRSEGESSGTASSRPSTPSRPSTSTPSRPGAPAPRSGPVAGADGRWKVGDRLEVNQRAYWYPARIIAINGGRYRVHYEGYGSEDDEWVDTSRMRPIGGHRVAAACTYEPPGPAVTGRSGFSEALAKRRIYDQYGRSANGTLSAPLRIGVTFLDFTLGGTYRNTVANVPGRGAQRRHGGAPVGATIYTFRSKHVVCEQYRDGVKRRMVEGTHACFVDRDGEWTCPSENDTRITQLDQE